MSLYKFFPKIPKITKSTSKEILNSASELIAQPAQASPSTTTENPIQITIETVIEKPQSEENQSLTSRTSATELDISFEINKSSTSFGESEPLTILINLMIDFGILMSIKYCIYCNSLLSKFIQRIYQLLDKLLYLLAASKKKLALPVF